MPTQEKKKDLENIRKMSDVGVHVALPNVGVDVAYRISLPCAKYPVQDCSFSKIYNIDLT